MSQQANDPPRVCSCSNDTVCNCTIEVLRDLRMQALQLASQEDVSDGRLRFFPRESVLREISPAFVRKVLQKVSNTNDDIAEGLQQATNRVCPRNDCYCKKPLCTGNRVIFASLLFIIFSSLARVSGGEATANKGPEGSSPDLSFALELKTNNAIPYSDRILSLLAAFEHRRTFYLLFPWAELGHLGNIWREYSTQPDGATGQRVRHATWYSPQWLLGECHGIASAVAEIHGLKGSTPSQPCIFHTDIKPDNILAFYDCRQDRVSLKLADFGHARLMSTPSSSVSGLNMSNALSYRAPEYDTQSEVTIKYDVWSLGCVFLEFVTWALQGGDKVAEFAQKRLNEEMDPKANYSNFSEDTFFERVAGHRHPFPWSKLHHVLQPTTTTKDLKGNFSREISFTLPGLNRSVVTQVRETVSIVG
ncbi:kinase-like domain-containing protein [Apiospora arundinis]